MIVIKGVFCGWMGVRFCMSVRRWIVGMGISGWGLLGFVCGY